MTSVADLKAGEYGRIAYLLVIEGIEQMWTTEPDIAGSGASSWINTTYGTRRVIHGLDWESIRVGLDWQTGMLDTDGATFDLLDDDGTLATLFASEPDWDDLEPIGESIPPTEDPAAATKLLYGTIDGTENVTIRDRHVGTEYIDAIGQRRELWLAPAHASLVDLWAAPLDHPMVDHEDGEAAQTVLGRVVASEEPHIWAGRKVALYVIHYDHHTGSWPLWHEAVAAGGMIWHGTLRDQARMAGPRQWSIECDGPHSWRQKLLNSYRPSAGFDVRDTFALSTGAGDTEREDAIYVQFAVNESGIGSTTYGVSAFDSGEDLGQTDPGLLIVEINTLLDATRDADASWASGFGADTGNEFANFAGADEFKIQWEDDTDDDHYAYVNVIMHQKVWARLGWDPVVQAGLPRDDPHWVYLLDHLEDFQPPGPGYLGVRFFTTPVYGSWAELNDLFQQGVEPDNNGAPRVYKRMWGGPVVTIDPDANQELGIGSGRIYNEGQLAQPPSETYDATGFFAFVGQILRAGEEDPVDLVQVAKCSWDLEGNRMDQNAEEQAAIRVDAWLDPKRFGFEHDKITAPWVQIVGGIKAYPLAVIGGYRQGNALDESHLVLGRLHTSSGTATPWDSHDQDPDAVIVPGDNDPDGTADADFHGGDLEIQDLGLNLPPAFVDFASMREAADNLPNGAFGAGLGKIKVSTIGPVQARGVIQSIQRPRGMATSWKPTGSTSTPAFGAFSKFATITQEQVEVTITVANKHGDPTDPMSWYPGQSLRFAQPVDAWVYRWWRSPLDSKYAREVEFQSLDSGVRHRRGDVVYTVEDPYAVGGSGQLSQARSRMQNAAAEWYAKRHFPVTLMLQATKAQELGIGTIVRLTDPDVVDAAGAYGITNRLGRVISKNLLKGEHAEVTILVQADNPNNTRHWAPVARVYGWDVAGSEYALTLAGPAAHSALWAAGDAWETDDGKSDALGFAEPLWSTTGGDAKVQIHQSFDGGRTWGDIVTGVVTAADTAAHTVAIDTVAGTLYRDTDKIMTLRPYADQDSDSWTRTTYAVVTESNGKHNGVKGKPLS